MDYTLDNEVLSVQINGELNSYNAEQVEKEVEATINGKTFNKLILDFANLYYISSAGLRIVLKLKQKYSSLTIIDATLEVYDILQMTGFTNIIEVKKALHRVDVSKAEVIGTGFFSTVYRINKDTIIKVFNKTSDAEQIERELRLAKEAFILGIPTAISFDVVKVNDKLGVRFEMLDCMSLKNAIIDYPKEAKEYIEKYADLLKKINTTECDDPKIPDIKKFYLAKIDKLKADLPANYYEKAKKMLEAIEDRRTLIHGDCHFKNIFVQNGELLLIDMDTLSIGYPIFELAAICASYTLYDEDEAGNSEKFFGIKYEDALNLYNSVVNHYLGQDDMAKKEKIKLVAYIHLLWWNRINEPNNLVRYEGVKERLVKLLDKYDDLDIGV